MVARDHIRSANDAVDSWRTSHREEAKQMSLGSHHQSHSYHTISECPCCARSGSSTIGETILIDVEFFIRMSKDRQEMESPL